MLSDSLINGYSNTKQYRRKSNTAYGQHTCLSGHGIATTAVFEYISTYLMKYIEAVGTITSDNTNTMFKSFGVLELCYIE